MAEWRHNCSVLAGMQAKTGSLIAAPCGQHGAVRRSAHLWYAHAA